MCSLFSKAVSINFFIVSQWAYGARMTSYQRRCDVITSHRRLKDVILRHVPAGFYQLSGQWASCDLSSAVNRRSPFSPNVYSFADIIVY